MAFILALVVRGFEAQAFVIPTGSMAPTLMGRHKEIACPQCGFVYAVNASQEVEARSPSRNVHSGICVNCRYQARRGRAASFKGDRILVMMFPYDLPFLPGSGPPERWDVVVFRYPEEPEVSYIKRLVGLPGETIRIFHGDIFVKSGRCENSRWPGSRGHQAAMQITAYDDRHRPRILADKPSGSRWRSESRLEDRRPGGRADIRLEGGAKDQWAELRYRHLVPDPEQWDALSTTGHLPRPPRSTLITDFYSYNTNMSADASSLLDDPRGRPGGSLDAAPLGRRSDARIHRRDHRHDSQRIAVGSNWSRRAFRHRCTDRSRNRERVVTRGERRSWADGRPRSRVSGRHQVAFANVDDGMTLSVDGTPVDRQAFALDTIQIRYRSRPRPTCRPRPLLFAMHRSWRATLS